MTPSDATDATESVRAVFKDFPKVREAEFDMTDDRKSWQVIHAIKASLE